MLAVIKICILFTGEPLRLLILLQSEHNSQKTQNRKSGGYSLTYEVLHITWWSSDRDNQKEENMRNLGSGDVYLDRRLKYIA